MADIENAGQLDTKNKTLYDWFSISVCVCVIENTRSNLQWPKLNKPVCLISFDFTCASYGGR